MTSCQSQKKIVSVNKDTNEFTMRKGQDCEIMFRTNASTGFWWQWVNEEEVTIVESVGDRYESDAPKGMVGASSLLEIPRQGAGYADLEVCLCP